MRKTNCSGSSEASRCFSLKKLGLQENCIDKEKTAEDQTGKYVPQTVLLLGSCLEDCFDLSSEQRVSENSKVSCKFLS